jgi:hypothetical protein
MAVKIRFHQLTLVKIQNLNFYHLIQLNSRIYKILQYIYSELLMYFGFYK